MSAIFLKELKSYFTSLSAYIYFGIYFLLTGIFFVTDCLNTYSTQFGYYVLSRTFFVMVAVIPFCTMRLLAQERRHKTDQLLFTAPVSAFSILAGKYLATVVYVLLPVILSAVYPIMIAMHGEMSIRFLIGTYIAVVLVTLVLLSIGMFLSSLTTNIVLAALMSYAVYVLILLGRIAEGVTSDVDNLYQFFHEISIYNKYNDMISGIVRSGDILYLLLLVICFFLLTLLVLESRRQTGKQIAGYMVAVVAVTLVMGTVFLSNTKVYDFTAEQLLTLSEDTKQAVAEVDQPTEIYYMGVRSRANATYRELMTAYQNLNDNITVEYVDVENDSMFRAQYLNNVNAVHEGSLLVVCGDKSIYLDSNNYIISTWTSAYSYERKLMVEEQLTRAIIYTNVEEADKLCVLTGHEEESLNSGFENLLLLNNYELKNVNLTSAITDIKEIIPEDCRAAFINAPQSDFSEDELAVLREYLQNGGKLFVTLDPLNEELENLYDFLRDYGLEVTSGVVIEQEQGRYAYDTPYYLIPQIQDTEYTKDILKDKLVVLTMTSKGIRKNGEANGYVCTDILTTSPHAFSKVSNFDTEQIATKSEDDIAGPFSVASCAKNPKAGAVFLLTSNVFFNEDADLESMGANRRFFVEILSELTDTEASVWIDGKNVGNQMALYPSKTQPLLKVVTIIVIPIVILVVGIIVVWSRKTGIFLKRRKKEENE